MVGQVVVVVSGSPVVVVGGSVVVVGSWMGADVLSRRGDGSRGCWRSSSHNNRFTPKWIEPAEDACSKTRTEQTGQQAQQAATLRVGNHHRWRFHTVLKLEGRVPGSKSWSAKSDF